MGKQTSSILKGKAEALLTQFPDKFTDDFEKNKETLKETKLFEYSKTDRNIVAGMITRIKKREKKKED